MLKGDLKIDTSLDPLLDLLNSMNGVNAVKQIEPGFWLGGINFDHRIDWDSLDVPRESKLEYQYPEFGPEFHELSVGFACYGVCDTPQQFIHRYRNLLEKDERTFVVSFGHIAKDPSNAGEGGGWRWHKWGGYIGDGCPQCEYLDDEEGFDDGVYVYHVYQVAGPIKKGGV